MRVRILNRFLWKRILISDKIVWDWLLILIINLSSAPCSGKKHLDMVSAGNNSTSLILIFPFISSQVSSCLKTMLWLYILEFHCIIRKATGKHFSIHQLLLSRFYDLWLFELAWLTRGLLWSFRKVGQYISRLNFFQQHLSIVITDSIIVVNDSLLVARDSKMTCMTRCETITGILRVIIVFDKHRVWRR